MYASTYHYTKKYLLGMDPVIPDAEFSYWEKQARAVIDSHTFNRLRADSALVTDAVKDCVCEVAELLYKAGSLAEQARENGGAGLLASYSNDGDSGSFDLSGSPYTEKGKAVKMREIIHKYLSSTGLLYAGACP